MKKRILSLVMALVLAVGLLPMGAMAGASEAPAAEENISVTVRFDASVVAEDMPKLYQDLCEAGYIDEITTNLPDEITVTVPSGSTVKEVLKVAVAQSPFSIEGLESEFVTQVGFVSNEILSSLVNIDIGNSYSGNTFSYAGWLFYIDGIGLTRGIGSDTVSTDGAVIEGRYSLYNVWDSTDNAMVFYDEAFLNAYHTLQATTERANTTDTTDFTDLEKADLTSAVSSANELLTSIYNEAALTGDAGKAAENSGISTSGGMWIGYFETKGTSLWGPGSPTEQLKAATVALEKAIDPPADNILEALAIGTLVASDYESDSLISFDSGTKSYVVNNFTSNNTFASMVKYYAKAASNHSTVSVSLNGKEIASPTSYWTTYNSLNWTDYYCNTLVFTVTPPASSQSEPSVYTVKLYRVLTDREKLSCAKEKLTWDLIKGLNTNSSSVISPLSLPEQITLTDNLGTVSVSWTSNNTNIIANNGTISRPAERTEVTLTATLTSGTETDTVLFPVTVTPPSTADADASKVVALMDGIASGYTDTYNNSKVIIDMAAYEDLKPDTAHKTTADAKQKYVNFVASAVTDSSAGDTTCALSIISLQGLGYDPQQLYPVNSNTALNIVTKLNGVAHAESAWSAPYTLAAYNQGGYDTDSYEQALITKILANQENDGSWTEWGDSIQTTANMIMGLSFYRNQNDVQTAIKKAIAYLSGQQKANGTFDAYGSGPDTDACANVVMALAAMGINPDTDQRFIKNGNSALDGLLLFALPNNSGFGHRDNNTPNSYATEEGFRALIAAAQVMSTGKPYNIYDFSANSVTPARETSTSSSDESTTPPPDPNNDITVTVTIKADTGYWLRSKSVTVSEGSTVCDAFVTALEGTEITQVGAKTGYIRSITKNGVTLAEFTQGPNSGWLYKVNGELPTVGVTSCSVHQGDAIVLYYTEDWTKDPSAGSGGGVIPSKPETPASSLTPEVSANSKGEATVKVDANAVEDSLAQAEKENASALVIAPKVTGQADTVTTQLPLSAAETISQDSDLDLTVQTEDAAVTIPNEALGSIVTQSSGSQTIEVVVKTCDPNTLKDQAAGLDLENAAAVEVTIRSGGSPITTFGGQTLAIDLPVDKTVYTEGAQYKVLVLSADGTVETLTGQCIREQGRLVVRVFTPHLSTFLVTTQTVLPFTDVDGHWALDAIRFVYDQGLMTGTKETQFSPKKPLNRAMLATILYRMEGSPAVTGENPYTDVAAGTWYTDAVLWASEQGIVNGYGNGKFGPLNNITREQLAAMLLRYSDYKKYNTDARNDLASYADADDISAWALEALRWANAQGLVTGRTETTLVPQGDTTRAETATILMRYLDTIAG